MAEIYANNVRGKLAEPITPLDTSLPLEAGHSLPDPGTNWYRATLYRWEFTSEGIREFDHEVVKVTGLAGDTLTVERALEGMAQAYDPETPIEVRMTAGALAEVAVPWMQVQEKPDTATRWPTFTEVTNKPNTYPPSTHNHTISEVTNLQSSLDAKRAQTDTAFPRYDLASATTTATLDLAQQQVFRVSATSNRTLSLSNAPGTGRAMTVVIRLTGSSGTITWPAGIEWAEGTAPELRDSWTVVTLMWDGATWRGFVSGGAD